MECCLHYQKFDCDSVAAILILWNFMWYSQTNGLLCTTTTFFVPASIPYIDSFLNLSATATPTKACHQLAKNNLSTTASFSATDEKVRNGHENWSLRHFDVNRGVVFWLCSFHTAAVSINCLRYFFVLSFCRFNIFIQNIIQVVLCISSLCILFMIGLT